MVRHNRKFITCLLTGLILLLGCSKTQTQDGAVAGSAGEPAVEVSDAAVSDMSVDAFFEHVLVPSIKSRVKFKGAKRFGTDLASALGIEPEALCNELGLYNCLEVHQIVLGGMEPYRLGINKPLPKAGLTAPIAADRVALAACAERVKRDFSSDGPSVLFERLPEVDARPSSEWRQGVANQLYQRVLRRAATSDESAALVNFYDEVELEHGGASTDTTKDWLSLSCFAVSTMLEALFY
jgi:hypothetical protein